MNSLSIFTSTSLDASLYLVALVQFSQLTVPSGLFAIQQIYFNSNVPTYLALPRQF